MLADKTDIGVLNQKPKSTSWSFANKTDIRVLNQKQNVPPGGLQTKHT